MQQVVWTLREILGSGSNGIVCKAKKKFKQKEIALKIYKHKVPIERRMNEMKLLKKFKHPNIIKCVDFDHDNKEWIALTLGLKFTLWEFAEIAPMTQDIGGYILFKLLIGVEQIHNKGYAHRDIKMDNILIDPQTYEIMISDFELSGPLENVSFSGTVNFIAPELYFENNNELKDEKKVFKPGKSDVFSIGVVAYFLLFSKLPFEKSTETMKYTEGWSLIINEKWDEFWGNSQMISQDVKFCLENLLHPDPQYRWSINQARQSKWIERSSQIPSNVYLNEMKSRHNKLLSRN